MSFTLIKVGTKDRPATKEDIQDIKQMVVAVMKDQSLSLVTHHAVVFEKIPTYDGIITVYKVGDEDCPASSEDIADLQKELTESAAEKRPVVWYHNLKIEYLKL